MQAVPVVDFGSRADHHERAFSQRCAEMRLAAFDADNRTCAVQEFQEFG
jgi:hypothetical protein